jgi:hypothetical protein
MKRLSLCIALGLVLVTAFCLAIWGQGMRTVSGQVQPFVIDITQLVPVQVSVPIAGATPVTMTLPLTISANLRVKVDTASRKAKVEKLSASTPIVAVIPSGQEQQDALGLTYEFLLDANELEITEWTVYESTNGWVSFSGRVAMSDDANPFDDIECVIRAYKNDKLVRVEEVVNVGYYLEPGGTNRFDGVIAVQPTEIDRYTVEFTILR